MEPPDPAEAVMDSMFMANDALIVCEEVTLEKVYEDTLPMEDPSTTTLVIE